MNNLNALKFIVIIFATSIYAKEKIQICLFDIVTAISQEKQAKLMMKVLQKNDYKRKIILESQKSNIRDSQALIHKYIGKNKTLANKKEKELKNQAFEFELLYQKMKQSSKTEKIKILKELEQKNNIIIKIVSMQNKCDITIAKEATKFFAKKRIRDITDQVIFRFNKEY